MHYVTDNYDAFDQNHVNFFRYNLLLLEIGIF